MKDVMENIGTLYHPKTALVFYEAKGTNTEVYVEYFDMDRNGNPINAHPLTVKEAQYLSKALDTTKERNKAFLKSKSIIAGNVLYTDPSENGFAIWFTKATSKNLFFIDGLNIPNGVASVPALLWIASKQKLYIYALKSDRKPTERTPLYHAPFFNVYADGNVCMGSVDVSIRKSASLEEFIAAWETYFFNSYFSHLMQNHNPIQGNCVSLWKKLRKTGEPFPKDVLKKTDRTIKNILI
ncbi:MAG: PRTRC system protein B [Citrobacter freundii]|jgi:PRTRC genetic system protein B|nr:MAG: PRTRC system protein B [Sphingobacteriales bacterium 40-81]PZR22216.1 MAG: PRTRC system protein B [Citrobacter freundii]